jgi:hypothetical protein
MRVKGEPRPSFKPLIKNVVKFSAYLYLTNIRSYYYRTHGLISFENCIIYVVEIINRTALKDCLGVKFTVKIKSQIF